MSEMQSHLSSWRAELERELLALEQQINDLRSIAADKRQKIDAIDRLLSDRPVPATVTIFAVDANAVDDDDSLTTPGSAYWQPILSVLVELGGRGRRRKVIELVGAKMKPIFTPADYADLPSHGVRWRTRVTFQASHMRRVANLLRNAILPAEFGKSPTPAANGSPSTASHEPPRHQNLQSVPFNLPATGQGTPGTPKGSLA